MQDSQRLSGLAATRWIVRNYDLDFLKKFSLVIGFLVLVTLGLGSCVAIVMSSSAKRLAGSAVATSSVRSARNAIGMVR